MQRGKNNIINSHKCRGVIMNKKALSLLLLVSFVGGSVKAGTVSDHAKSGFGHASNVLRALLWPERSINRDEVEYRKKDGKVKKYKVKDEKDSGEAKKYEVDQRGTCFVKAKGRENSKCESDCELLIDEEGGQPFVNKTIGEEKFENFWKNLPCAKIYLPYKDQSWDVRLCGHVKTHFWKCGVLYKNVLVPTAAVIVAAKVLKKLHKKFHDEKKHVDFEDEDFDA